MITLQGWGCSRGGHERREWSRGQRRQRGPGKENRGRLPCTACTLRYGRLRHGTLRHDRLRYVHYVLKGSRFRQQVNSISKTGKQSVQPTSNAGKRSTRERYIRIRVGLIGGRGAVCVRRLLSTVYCLLCVLGAVMVKRLSIDRRRQWAGLRERERLWVRRTLLPYSIPVFNSVYSTLVYICAIGLQRPRPGGLYMWACVESLPGDNHHATTELLPTYIETFV